MLTKRKSPAHFAPLERHNVPIIILVTVCTQFRRPIPANTDTASVISGAWTEAAHWNVGRYVIMPDHIHLFCSPNSLATCEPLSKWIRYWKSIASFNWPRRDEAPIWQRGFWDRQLRHHTHYGHRWHYVRNNPVRAGLVACADDWPFQGEQHELRC